MKSETQNKYVARISCFVYADTPEKAMLKAEKIAENIDVFTKDDLWASVDALEDFANKNKEIPQHTLNISDSDRKVAYDEIDEYILEADQEEEEDAIDDWGQPYADDRNFFNTNF